MTCDVQAQDDKSLTNPAKDEHSVSPGCTLQRCCQARLGLFVGYYKRRPKVTTPGVALQRCA